PRVGTLPEPSPRFGPPTETPNNTIAKYIATRPQPTPTTIAKGLQTIQTMSNTPDTRFMTLALQHVLTTFLTMCHNEPFLCVVHSMGPFIPELGVASVHAGSDLFFLGDMVGDQLPPMYTTNEEDFFARQDCVVPTLETFGRCLRLDPKSLITIPLATADHEKVSIAWIAYIPLCWAPYFMENDVTPGKGYLLIQNKVAQANSVELNIAVVPLQQWLRAAAIQGKSERQSKLTVD
ncbi:MAG: hypothetical protein ACRDL7_16580, partial [Gaiellaceae bacterium]